MTATALFPLSQHKAFSYSFGATIVVCRKCCNHGQTGGDFVRDVTKAAEGTIVSVRSVACLGNCHKGLNAALMAPRSWSYIFNGLQISDASDLVGGATALSFSDDGQVSWNEWTVSLKKALIAQIPSFEGLD